MSIRQYILCCFLVIIHAQLFGQATSLCNGSAMNATPFCTDENPYGITYPAGIDGYATELWNLNSTGCIDPDGGSDNPAWYKMRISDPGDLTIYMQHSNGGDIDYACWGPFSDADMNNMCSSNLNNYLYDNLPYSSIPYYYYCCDYYYSYTCDYYEYDISYSDYYYDCDPISYGYQYFSHHPSYTDYTYDPYYHNPVYGHNWMYDWYANGPRGKLVDCSSTHSADEYVHIRNAQVGQWYILYINNWEGLSGNISFNRVDAQSTAHTDCSITSPITGDEICEGGTATLTAQIQAGAVWYQWTGPNNFSQTTTTNTLTLQNVTSAQAGTYTMRVWNGNIYGNATTCELIVHPNPVIQLPENVYICPGNSITLTASGAEVYLWNNGGNSASITVSPTVSTTYYVTGTSFGLCNATASVNVHVNNIADIVLYDTICQNQPYNGYGFTYDATQTGQVGTLTAHESYTTQSQCDSNVTLYLTVKRSDLISHDTAFCEGNTFVWEGETYTESGTYGHIFTNSVGCDSGVVYNVTVYPHYEITDHLMLCRSALPYHYWPADTTFGVDTRDTSSYYFLRPARTGCDSNITLFVQIYPDDLRLDCLTEDFCQNYSAILQVTTNMENVEWSTGEHSEEITVHRPGAYTVRAHNGPCDVSARYTIQSCEFNLYLPNSITPLDGDGNNDFFYIPDMIADQLTEFEISIYDRYGRIVFTSRNPHFRWDGSEKGKRATNVVYVYRITYRDINNIKRQTKGTITVF